MRGIHFVSIHEGVDTSTPQGRLVFGIFASIAKFERELIRERVKSGLRKPNLFNFSGRFGFTG